MLNYSRDHWQIPEITHKCSTFGRPQPRQHFFFKPFVNSWIRVLALENYVSEIGHVIRQSFRIFLANAHNAKFCLVEESLHFFSVTLPIESTLMFVGHFRKSCDSSNT